MVPCLEPDCCKWGTQIGSGWWRALGWEPVGLRDLWALPCSSCGLSYGGFEWLCKSKFYFSNYMLSKEKHDWVPQNEMFDSTVMTSVTGRVWSNCRCVCGTRVVHLKQKIFTVLLLWRRKVQGHNELIFPCLSHGAENDWSPAFFFHPLRVIEAVLCYGLKNRLNCRTWIIELRRLEKDLEDYQVQPRPSLTTLTNDSWQN